MYEQNQQLHNTSTIMANSMKTKKIIGDNTNNTKNNNTNNTKKNQKPKASW